MANLLILAVGELPINYGSQIDEHHAVRTDAGMFDVSHMLVTDINGDNAKAFYKSYFSNDVAKLGFVGGLYILAMLNDDGGVIDDLIVYRMNEDESAYRIISNGATREKTLHTLPKLAGHLVSLDPTP